VPAPGDWLAAEKWLGVVGVGSGSLNLSSENQISGATVTQASHCRAVYCNE
jgi:hypothetical protein